MFSAVFCAGQDTESSVVAQPVTPQEKISGIHASKIRRMLFAATGLTVVVGCLYYAHTTFFKDHGGTDGSQDPLKDVNKKRTGSSNKPSGSCKFCNIIDKEVPQNEVVPKIYADTDSTITIQSTNRGQPLVMPKKHFTDVTKIQHEDKDYIWKIIEGLQKLARGEITTDVTATDWFRVEVNNGQQKAGQGVFHTHWHFFRGEGTATPPVTLSQDKQCQCLPPSIEASKEGLVVIEKKDKSHYFIFPKRHISNIMSLTASDTELLWHMVEKTQQLAHGKEFNIYINTGSGKADKPIGTSKNSFIQEYPHLYWEIVVRDAALNSPQ